MTVEYSGEDRRDGSDRRLTIRPDPRPPGRLCDDLTLVATWPVLQACSGWSAARQAQQFVGEVVRLAAEAGDGEALELAAAVVHVASVAEREMRRRAIWALAGDRVAIPRPASAPAAGPEPSSLAANGSRR